MELIRTFVAFDVGDVTVLRNLSNAENMLVDTGASLRLVKPENIHMTIRFLGNISPRQIDEVHGEMEKIDFSPFEIKGVGVFPSLRRISVV